MKAAHEQGFTIKAYGFTELAACYLPMLTKESAANQLRAWIKGSQQVQEELAAAHYKAGQRLLTPRQVGILVAHFGEP